MPFFSVGLADDVAWKISKQDLSSLPLDPLTSGRLWNPLLGVAIGWWKDWVLGPFLLDNETTVVFSSRELLVEVPAEDASDDLFELVPRLVGALRHLSGQFRLSAPVGVAHVASLGSSLTPAPLPQTRDVWPRVLSLAGQVRGSLLKYGAPFDAVPDAARLAHAGGPPAWSVFLLDALRAHSAGDWKMAFLLGAFAVETGVGEALDEWHAMKLACSPSAPGVIEAPDAEGSVRLVDPVYDALAERAPFRLSLHERPIHLGRRSLLLEDKPTFDAMLRLYTTRSRIAHLGAPTAADTKSYALTGEDSRTALDRACRCLAFFGKTPRARMERDEMVPAVFGEFPQPTRC